MRPPGRQHQIADQELGRELRRPRERLAVGADNDTGPVEDQLVLAAHHVAEREGRPVGAARSATIASRALPLPR